MSIANKVAQTILIVLLHRQRNVQWRGVITNDVIRKQWSTLNEFILKSIVISLWPCDCS